MDGYDFQKLYGEIILRTLQTIPICITQVTIVRNLSIKLIPIWISIIIWKDHNFVLNYQKKFERQREPVFADGGTTNEVEEVEKREDNTEGVGFEGLDCRFRVPLLPLRPVVCWTGCGSHRRLFCFCGLWQLFGARCR